MLVLKGPKNDSTPGADSVVNDFFKSGGFEVIGKLIKIMNMIFRKKEQILTNFRKTLIKHLYKQCDKMGVLKLLIGLFSVGSKVL